MKERFIDTLTEPAQNRSLHKKLMTVTQEVRRLRQDIKDKKEEEAKLVEKIWSNLLDTMPYRPSYGEDYALCGLYAISENGDIEAVYWNTEEKTYYREPLRLSDGTILGEQTDKQALGFCLHRIVKRKYKDVTTAVSQVPKKERP